MKKQSNKNGYAKVLKDKVYEIALECGFYKESNNPANLSSNYRDPVLPLLIPFYATTGTIGISYCKGCKQKMIKDIFENPLNYV